MLKYLSVNNLVLLKSLALDFGKGLCVFTGETGAGKSVLINSMNLIMGKRMNYDFIGNHSDNTVISAIFEIEPDEELQKVLERQGVKLSDDNQLMIKRIVDKEGKSRILINDMPFTLGALKDIMSYIIEVHGQFDNQKLLMPNHHIDILDSYGNLINDKKQLAKCYQDYMSIKKEIALEEQKYAEIDKEYEFLVSSIQEIENLQTYKEEEEELINKKNLVTQKAELIQLAKNIMQSLGKEGVLENIDKAIISFNQLLDRETDFGEDIKQAIQSLESAFQVVDETKYKAQGMFDTLTSDDLSLEEIQERLINLRSTARKHNIMPFQLPELLATMQEKLSTFEKSGSKVEELRKELVKIETNYSEQANALHEKRLDVSSSLSSRVNEEIKFLKLGKAIFNAKVEKTGEITAKGFNNVYFEVQTNPGSGFNLLHRIVSGGELSRFMLALKIVLSGTSSVSTVIFDEIDQGVGGEVAEAIGKKLKSLAKSIQVIVVTHSHQVASCANLHFMVQKIQDSDYTETRVYQLDADKRIDEIARMIAGKNISDELLLTAKRMLEENIV